MSSKKRNLYGLLLGALIVGSFPAAAAATNCCVFRNPDGCFSNVPPAGDMTKESCTATAKALSQEFVELVPGRCVGTKCVPPDVQATPLVPGTVRPGQTGQIAVEVTNNTKKDVTIGSAQISFSPPNKDIPKPPPITVPINPPVTVTPGGKTKIPLGPGGVPKDTPLGTWNVVVSVFNPNGEKQADGVKDVQVRAATKVAKSDPKTCVEAPREPSRLEGAAVSDPMCPVEVDLIEAALHIDPTGTFLVQLIFVAKAFGLDLVPYLKDLLSWFIGLTQVGASCFFSPAFPSVDFVLGIQEAQFGVAFSPLVGQWLRCSSGTLIPDPTPVNFIVGSGAEGNIIEIFGDLPAGVDLVGRDVGIQTFALPPGGVRVTKTLGFFPPP